MIRNLDLTALRSFVTVAETGGVTKAAHQLNLTQSAVSMQIKRLEDMLQQPLLDRAGRRVALTAHGEQLLGYGRRILAINDEVISRMMHTSFEGEVRFGVPTDIVYPNIPRVLRQFDREFPRVKIQLGRVGGDELDL
ncbi:MAG: LysR family transcriptional regulator, partial [Pseudomonadota bacterium]